MTGKAYSGPRPRLWKVALPALVMAVTWASVSGWAQSGAGAIPAIPGQLPMGESATGSAGNPLVDPAVVPAGCSTCGKGLIGDLAPPGGGCACGTCGQGCVPGRDMSACGACQGETPLCRLACGLYECICCPDPCYEPKWLPVADSAFFVDAARPITQMRLRYETDFDITQPDRAEYLFARFNSSNSAGKGLNGIVRSIREDQLSLYTEAAAGAFGMSVEIPYQHIDPTTTDIFPSTAVSASGFCDMNIATKAVLLDCQLLCLTFQFKTFIPTGSPAQGLGTGHVSLEPSLLFNLCLMPDCYLQGQMSYWIPIAGDMLYEGNIFHNHLSLNKVLCCPLPRVQVVGTLEANEWTILNGNYTATDFTSNGTPVAVSARGTFFSAGPGIRAFICDKIDFGVGTAFAFTGSHWAEEVIRAEFRWRF